MPLIEDHPLRHALVNELHARPFPAIQAPAQVAYVAIKDPVDAANRNRARDHAHLCDLLERNGSFLPTLDATHHAAPLGRSHLAWESHTEFVTYLAHAQGVSARAFDPAETEVFPADWLAAAPGKRIAAVQVRIEPLPEDPDAIIPMIEDWFVAESLVCAWVLDGAAIVATDFRIDANGQMRFALFPHRGTGPGRIGRIVQWLCEMETYRAMSMLGLGRARGLTRRLNELEPRLSEVVNGMGGGVAEDTLQRLLTISAELEALAVGHSFRFGATGAYAAIVRERVDVLRESRVQGRQKFGEFMLRRYEPAMRTVISAEARLQAMVERASRAAESLRTQVEVARQSQNQKVLESMDRRADLQLRLQHTVEGLSVVAISYYAVSLAGYLSYPLAKHFGLSKEMAIAGLTPLVILGVWMMIRRIRKGFH